MRFRITVETKGGETKVQVDGDLVGEGPRELRRACAGIAGAFTLELAGLERVDQSGIELLRALMGTGASLRGMNPYMALLLQGSGDLA